MASGRRLRTRSSKASAQPQLSDCGHDRSFLDFSSDRDIQCLVCWENREILIQRLIEPFEYALETLNVNTGSASPSQNSTPERASSADGAVLTSEGSRSLRLRTGKKRTRSVSPSPAAPVATTTTLTTTTPMKIDEENLLGPNKPDEEDCIHVQNISSAILPPPPKKRSMTPEQAKTTKIAALEPQKASTNIITPVAEKAGNTSGGTTEKLQENPSPPANATPTLAPMAKLPKLQEKLAPTPPALIAKPAKPRTSLPHKKGQQTLFSFFTKPVALTGSSTKTEDIVTIKPDVPIISRAISNSAPIFGGGVSGCGGVKNKDVATKATEVMVVRKSTTPPARPLRPGTRKSARDVTVKSRETVNYREDSDSDIDLE